MSPAGSVQVVVDLERSAQTISGQITVAGAGPMTFFGWLELIDRLERAIDDRNDRNDRDDRDDRNDRGSEPDSSA